MKYKFLANPLSNCGFIRKKVLFVLNKRLIKKIRSKVKLQKKLKKICRAVHLQVFISMSPVSFSKIKYFSGLYFVN